MRIDAGLTLFGSNLKQLQALAKKLNTSLQPTQHENGSYMLPLTTPQEIQRFNNYLQTQKNH